LPGRQVIRCLSAQRRSPIGAAFEACMEMKPEEYRACMKDAMPKEDK